jgi:hypothetical protein
VVLRSPEFRCPFVVVGVSLGGAIAQVALTAEVIAAVRDPSLWATAVASPTARCVGSENHWIRSCHRRAVPLPERRAPFDIGEQEGDGAAGKIGHDPLQMLGWTWCCSIVASEENALGWQAGIVEAHLVLGTAPVLRLREAQPQPFQGEPAALPDDEVVEQLDIEQLPGRHDLDGEGHIGR